MKCYTLPLTQEEREGLRSGEIIAITGIVYTARDAAHKRLCEAIRQDLPLPFPLKGSAIYYSGPTPAREGEVIGSCGPTTSSRMDAYTPLLLENGLQIMIGKGKRSPAVLESILRNKAVYLVAVGGAAALMKHFVTACQVVAYADLGCEAVHELYVQDMQLAVAIDSRGNCIFPE